MRAARLLQDAPRKPGSAGKAGVNAEIRVVHLGSRDPDDRAAAFEEGEIIARLTSNEAFDGYWNRPDADRKVLVDGWYFTGDVGHIDADGDLFVTGRYPTGTIPVWSVDRNGRVDFSRPIRRLTENEALALLRPASAPVPKPSVPAAAPEPAIGWLARLSAFFSTLIRKA